MIEFWRAGGSGSSTFVDAAEGVEAEGWDGQMFMDSQSLGAEPYVLMGAWAMRTSRLKLSTGVTNPLTRHPAVTAAGAATVHMISGGRAVLGIGRGDSALAYLGRAPASLGAFESALQSLQTLLSGGEVEFSVDASIIGARSSDSLSLGNRPQSTRLQWLPPDLSKVPLDVAATGPKVIEMSARIAERVTFSVGAMPDQIDWALQTARTARTSSGLDEAGVSYGAQILVVCDTDQEAALAWAGKAVAPLARFQVMQSKAADLRHGRDRTDLETVRTSYDMTKHGGVHDDKLGGSAFTPEFVRRFAIVGPPDHCIERLLELASRELERFVIVGPGFYPDPSSGSHDLFASEVMPAVRATLRS